MADDIRVSGEVTIPGGALSMKAVRASGPGGQNVNKVSSKVELRLDPAGIRGLPEAARQRLLALAAKRLDAAGRILVVSQRSRDRHRNLEDARDRLRELVLRCLAAPRPRRPRRPSAASREARLRAKRRGAERKRLRGRPAADD